MKSRKACLLLASLLLAGACGTDDPSEDATDADNTDNTDNSDNTDNTDNTDEPGDIDAGTPDGGGPAGWTSLISGPWSLPSSTEDYWCVRVTVERDMYIGAIRPVAPLGTHHTVLSIGTPNGPDGGAKCGAGTNRTQWLYASGVGTEELILPEGVGLFVPAGQQLLLNLHLYNVQDQELTGVSGVEIQEITKAEVVHEAEVFMPGPVFFQLPEGMPTIDSTCTLQADQTLIALFPHMHKRGVHFKNTITKDGQPMVIWDKAYEFEDQPFARLPELIEVGAGDTIKTECTYVVEGGSVSFGDSSDQEMCFSIMMRYPRLNASPVPYCIN